MLGCKSHKSVPPYTPTNSELSPSFQFFFLFEMQSDRPVMYEAESKDPVLDPIFPLVDMSSEASIKRTTSFGTLTPSFYFHFFSSSLFPDSNRTLVILQIALNAEFSSGTLSNHQSCGNTSSVSAEELKRLQQLESSLKHCERSKLSAASWQASDPRASFIPPRPMVSVEV